MACPEPESVFDVFFSYNRSDQTSVLRLADLLSQREIKVWLDEWNLVPGTPWQAELEVALGKCRSVAVLLGPNGVSPWQREEMRAAVERRVKTTDGLFRLIPTLLPGTSREDIAGLHFLLAATWVQFRSLDDEDALYRLECGIRGCEPNMRHRSRKHRNRRARYFFIVDGTIDGTDQAKIEAIVESLRRYSGDASLTLKAINPGSIKLLFEGSQIGFERLQYLVRTGVVSTVLGRGVHRLGLLKAQPKNGKCLVIMPFWQEGTTKHAEYRDVFDLIIRETLSPLGFECMRADILPSWPGSISESITAELRSADLVVADLTERSPNVFYEMGYRQALNRPIITISQGALAALPFNVHHIRTISYDLRDLHSIAEFKRQLGETAKLASRRGKQYPSSAAESLDRTTEISTELGVVGAYSSRTDAIESAFYRVMREEDQGIDIVGSTIFGLRGHRNATFENMMDLLRTKHANSRFRLRILMTHWEFITLRQDQEKTAKNVARYVISLELKDAVDVIKANGLEGCLKFYRGSPTCFTIVAHGQRQMLLNPYPYQGEASNSWCIIARETPGGIYSRFFQVHVEGPWQNANLAVPYTDQAYSELLAKHGQDMDVPNDWRLLS
jgi:nucleoside 2-deoxyribosyltransferase